MEFEHVTFDLPHGTFHALQVARMALTLSWSSAPIHSH
jgi:hypothetical protein